MAMEGLLLGMLWGLLKGGSLRNLAPVRFRGLWIFLAASALQMGAGFARIGGLITPAAFAWTFTATYGLVALGLAANRRHPGMLLALAGVGANLLVLAANGGRMPVAPGALAAAGLERELSAIASGAVAKYQVLGPGTRLPWLADVIALRPPYHPVRLVASPGDFLFAAGLARAAAAAFRSWGRGVRTGFGGAGVPAPPRGGGETR